MNPLRIFLLAALVLVVFSIGNVEADDWELTIELVGSYDTDDYISDVTISGNYAYVADRDELVILNIEDPSNPILVGNYTTDGSAFGVAISGNYVYVADYDEGLVILNIEDPANPTLAGSNDTDGTAYGVTISGNYAYVADMDNGLVILNIEDPTNPTLEGSYDTNGSARVVAISGNYVYVADYDEGLVILNIEDPANPTLVGSYDTDGPAQGVAVLGNYVYVADSSNGLVILNIEDPANPTLAGSYDTDGSAQGVAVLGNYAYVADDYNGLVIINIEDPNNPTLSGNYITDYALVVIISGNYTYITDGWNGLVVLEVGYTHPPEIGELNTDRVFEGQMFNFEVDASDADGDGLQYTWDMGDGSPNIEGDSVRYGYADDGVYIIVVSVSDGETTTTKEFELIVENMDPTVNVMYDEVKDEGTEASFAAQTVDVAADDVNVKWSFPDGSMMEGDFVQYKFTDDGEFVVVVTASDEDGGESSEHILVTVENVAPIFTEFVIQPQVKQYIEANFSVSASDPGDDTIVYNVDFGDGTPQLLTQDGIVSHKFVQDGTFTVTICAKDEDGGESCRQVVLPVTTFELPTAIAGSDMTVKPGDTVQFNGAGTSDEDGVIVLYEWDFDGDGIYELSSEDNGRTTNIYNIEGEYAPTLRVTDNIGHTASNSFKITVKADSKTEDPETEGPETEDPGIPSISLITSLISIGLIAIFRRK